MGKKYHIKPGDKFGRLTCIRFDHIGKHYRSYFLFKCECGKEKIILGSGVISGNTKSCGCFSAEIKKAKRLPDNRAVIYQIILGYKRHAKDRGYEWDLTFDEVVQIISKPCHYCGELNSNVKITKNFKHGFLYNGIDRVDNRIGYNAANCVSACNQCNRAKGALSKKEFIKWIKKLAEQWGSLL